MPVYEYRCTRCNHVYEEFHEVGGSPGPCPVCGGTPRRVFTSVGLVFKGSGFHTTDYRKAKPPSGDGASKESSKESSTDSAAKTDSSTSPASKTPSASPPSSD